MTDYPEVIPLRSQTCKTGLADTLDLGSGRDQKYVGLCQQCWQNNRIVPTIVARNVSNPGTEPQIALCYQRHGCHLFWQPTLLFLFCELSFPVAPAGANSEGASGSRGTGAAAGVAGVVGLRRAGWLRGFLPCLFASRLCGRFHFGFGRSQGSLKLQVRPSEFHQLLRKVSIEFLGCAGDCQWGGKSVVFGVRRLLRNDGGPDRIALNKGDGQKQPAFAQKGISSVNMGFPPVWLWCGFQ